MATRVLIIGENEGRKKINHKRLKVKFMQIRKFIKKVPTTKEGEQKERKVNFQESEKRQTMNKTYIYQTNKE